MRNEIESESAFIWKYFILWIFTPVRFVLFLFGKRKLSDVFKPSKYFWQFMWQPKFTAIIMVTIALCYVGSLFLGADTLESLSSKPSNILEGQFYTLVTAGFLHANLTHLLGNLLGIAIFGRIVERQFGFFKTMLIFFGALILSSVFDSIIHLAFIGENTASIGASGALMGLVSTAILVNPFYFTYIFVIPLPAMVVGWIVLAADIMGILNPSADTIAHFAHLGGFLSIGILMFLIEFNERERLLRGLVINIFSAIIAGMIYFYLMTR